MSLSGIESTGVNKGAVQTADVVLESDGSNSVQTRAIPSALPGPSTRSTAGGPAPGQAQKNYCGLVALTASTQTISLETVTTGKTYLVTDIIVTSTNSAAILVQLTAAGVAIFQAHANATKGIEAIGLETQPQATTGQVVAIVIPAGSGNVAFNIFGIEQ